MTAKEKDRIMSSLKALYWDTKDTMNILRKKGFVIPASTEQVLYEAREIIKKYN